MVAKIGLAAIRRTRLMELYQNLLRQERLSARQIAALLEFAVIFLNSNDTGVQQLGYRIILLYGLQYRDYIPLYDICLQKGFIPAAKILELAVQEIHGKEGFFQTLMSSYKETFKREGIYLTNQQYLLTKSFLKDEKGNSAAVVAPTSYGKSELMLSMLKDEPGNICVAVPTKALIAQTKRRILHSEFYDGARKIITHPEMYRDSDKGIIAVLTQERLLRLLQRHGNISFEIVFVDEAHNLLEDDERNRLLATTLILLNKRNAKSRFKFLTPFLVNVANLSVLHTDISVNELRIDEYLKSEKIYCYDFDEGDGLEIYDQFLDDFIPADEQYESDIDLIQAKMAAKNIIYLNKPSSIEKLAKNLCARLPKKSSGALNAACAALERHVHKDYFLVECLRRGVAYHHGSVPDSIKLYIEHLFSSLDDISFIATTSTLLEGVNIPAENIFVLDYKRGRSKLSPAQFKNLIGRVCRFREMFAPGKSNIKMLVPHVYVVASDYISKNANIKAFISDNMRVGQVVKEKPENVLLSETKIRAENRKTRADAEEFIENVEPGTLKGTNARYSQTAVGKACYLNSVWEFDVLKHENACQRTVDSVLRRGGIADSSEKVMELISQIFLAHVERPSLVRLKEPKARRFYAMFLDWRVKNTSFSEMIGSFLGYWRKLEGADAIVFVGNKWGDVSREQSHQLLWTDISSKTNSERVNLAIVRIKEEQDFIDHEIFKFVEVLNEVGLVEKDTFEKIKYGTSDPEKILFIQNGLSPSLATLLLKKYRSSVKVNGKANSVTIEPGVRDLMVQNKEDDLLIFELEYNIAMPRERGV